MAYTPELTQKNSATLRRIAWAADRPMTTTLQEIISCMGRIVDRRKICAKCKDRSKCSDCVFNKKAN